MRHLFICGTPLQAKIAEHIISSKQLSPSECSAFLYTKVENKKYLHYFGRISQMCNNSTYFVASKHTIKGLFRAKKEFRKMHFEKIYLASPMSAYTLIALSLGRHRQLYTFDDGTANIFSTSDYSKGSKLSLKKSLALKILGNSYTPDRVKLESLGHYTIYPGLQNNISEHCLPISLFPSPPSPSSNLKCSVLLGTVFDEVFENPRAIEILEKLNDLIGNISHDVFFIPHPRDPAPGLYEFATLESELMAEDEVIELLGRYSEIDLYGFCGTTQVNLAQTSRVKNIFLKTPETLRSFAQIEQIFNAMGWSFSTLEL